MLTKQKIANKLTNKELALVGVAAIAFTLAMGLIIDVQISYAQEQVATNTNDTDNTGTVVIQPQDGTDVFLGNINTTIAAISTLIATVVGIITYIVNTIRSKTGDKVVSDDLYNKFLDATAIIRQKDNELRDAYRQVMEQKEIVKLGFDALKGTNPELATKLDQAQAKANQTIQTQVLPQVAEWQTQADQRYDTLLKKKPVRS